MKKLIPILALASVCAAWGSTFFMVKDHVLDDVPASDFLTLRFTLAALIACALWFRELRTAGWKTLALGFGAGVLYGLGQLAQTWGLNLTSPATSGFITAMSIVLSGYGQSLTPEDLREKYYPRLDYTTLSKELKSYGVDNTDFYFDAKSLSSESII